MTNAGLEGFTPEGGYPASSELGLVRARRSDGENTELLVGGQMGVLRCECRNVRVNMGWLAGRRFGECWLI